jgi:hypothetical protein
VGASLIDLGENQEKNLAARYRSSLPSYHFQQKTHLLISHHVGTDQIGSNA